MSIVVDPTVPVVTEAESNGYVRIQNVAGWINALLGQASNAPFTYATNPFTVDSSGDVNITNGNSFTVGGSPILATTQFYKSNQQSASGAESDLILTVNANDRWWFRFVLITDITIGDAGSVTFTLTFPSGTTFTWAETVTGIRQTGSSFTSNFSTQSVWIIEGTAFVSSTPGSISLSYSSVSHTPNILAGSSLFAFKVTGA